MNKKGWIIAIILVIILIGAGFYFYLSKNNSNSTYQANKTSSTAENRSEESSSKVSDNKEKPFTNITLEGKKKPQYKEEQLATFSTKIYSKDSARQNNIQITCNTLNDTIVKNGEIFSFCKTIGQATSDKGYQEADIFDNNGKKKKGLGGGNCQVSSTLYNAVLATSNLVVTERHEHSNNVPYVKKGKDAAVAYGSYDFKFRNNTGNNIKIKASTDGKNVTTTIVSLKEV